MEKGKSRQEIVHDDPHIGDKYPSLFENHNYSSSLNSVLLNKGDLIGFYCGSPDFPQPFLLGFVSDFRNLDEESHLDTNGLNIQYRPRAQDKNNMENWLLKPEFESVLGLWRPSKDFVIEKIPNYEILGPNNNETYLARSVYAGRSAVLEGLKNNGELTYYSQLIRDIPDSRLKDFISDSIGNHRR